MSGTLGLVPIRPRPGAKSRLAPFLDAAERAGLAHAMARDVLAALTAAPSIDRVVVLAGGEGAPEAAREFGCRVLHDSPGLDLNANLDRAAATLAADGADTLLVVPADVPCIGAQDVSALLAAHRSGVTIVPAARDGGTNALVTSPPGVIGFAFGPDSARRHLGAARRCGVAWTSIATLDAFARDIDTPEDVRWLCALAGGAEKARRYLDEAGICARLRDLQPPGSAPMMPLST